MQRAMAMLALGVLTAGAAQARSLYWERIDVVVQVNRDGTFDVTETQEYVFDGAWNGGYRDIPLDNVDHISGIELWEGGRRYRPGSVDHVGGVLIQPGLRQIHVKWRSREVHDPPYRNAHEIFTLKYRVHGGLDFGRDHDQLHWKMLFPDRLAVVNEATATIRLPAGIPRGEVRAQLMALTRRGSDRKSVV